jgi:tape measure domain-containing protein
MSSKTIDEKVVEMRFDNSNFERNVSNTISTLDKLKAKLNLTGASKGLENLNTSANKVNLNGISNAIDTVKVKFSALETIGITALANITNRAVNAGINLTKSLSVDNILSGWTKLQQKSNSVSTLLSQGYDMKTVEEQMEKLNWFADETSYNYTDMIDNIAKFTASGKGLKESTSAMQGIALWAAKSGQNAQKASFAMYQLSQALGAGQMRLVDWKSVQSANMDTVEFREQAIAAAIELKKLKKVGKDTYQSLVGDKKKFTRDQMPESLSKGAWFTSDVMMKVYQRYSKGADQVKSIIDTMSDKHNIDLVAMDVIKAYKDMNKLSRNGETFADFLKENEITGDAAVELEKMVKNLDKFGMSALMARTRI